MVPRTGGLGVAGPREDYLAVLQGRRPERIPFFTANISDFLRFRYGLSSQRFVDEPEEHAAATLRFMGEFEFACVAPIAYILFGCGPEMGVKWAFSGGGLPGSTAGFVETLDDLERLRVPEEPGGHFANFLAVHRLLQEQAGDRYFVLGWVLGPFAAACFVRGLEKALLDPFKNGELHQACLERCVDLSAYFGQRVSGAGPTGAVLLEIFSSPDLMSPDYYHRFVRPFDLEVQARLKGEGIDLPNSFDPFMGRARNPESQELGRLMYHHFFGTRESLEVVRKAVEHDLPGFPAIITLSGRMMSNWPLERIREFIRRGLEFMVREKGLYPAVRLPSLLPGTAPEAREMAAKIRAVREVADNFSV